MSGQLVAYEPVWLGQRNRPAIQLRFRRPTLGEMPPLMPSVRILAGAGFGAMLGVTTSYFSLWIAIGAAVGMAANHIMARTAGA